MERKNSSIDEKIDKLIEKNMPTGTEAKRSNLWLGACATTVATGLYTYMLDWNPAIRAVAHLTGAFAIPAGGAFVSSLAMSGIEGVANLGINLYNKKHPEKAKEPFKINPKVRNAIKLVSSALVGIVYAYGTLGTEVDQFANSGIFQTEQYLADIGGSLAGIAAFHKLEPKDAFTSFMDKVNKLSKAIVKPINALEEKVRGKNKDDIEIETNLAEKDISDDEKSKTPQENSLPVWDLSLYKDSPKINNTMSYDYTKSNIQTNNLNPNSQSSIQNGSTENNSKEDDIEI